MTTTPQEIAESCVEHWQRFFLPGQVGRLIDRVGWRIDDDGNVRQFDGRPVDAEALLIARVLDRSVDFTVSFVEKDKFRNIVSDVEADDE